VTESKTPGRPKSNALNALLWFGPILLLFVIYREGLQCWFSADDFAWLGLLRQYHSSSDLPSILFSSAAQGTIRPWSERGFFLLFHSLFGFDNLPFRIAAFVTMSLDLLLVAWHTRRLTRSAFAGFLAAVIWEANSAVVTPLSWSSAFNELLCPLFLLSALALFVLYAESGKQRYWWGQLFLFVLGFGALEINIVYPALAASWALFVAPQPRRRKLLVSVVPLAIVSVAYFAVHRALAPFQTTGPYALHFDGRIFKTFAVYVKWSLLPPDWIRFGHSPRTGKLILWSGLISLAALFASRLKARNRIVLFPVAWYLACLAPVLPLPDHHTVYYLSIPMIGMAMMAAYGFSCVARQPASRLAASLAIVAYLAAMVPVSRSATHWWHDQTAAIRSVVLGVEAAHETHPDKTIVLDGIPPNVYNDSIGQGALYADDIDFVYLTPGSEQSIGHNPDMQDPEKIVLDPAVTLHAISNDSIVVYSFAGDHLRNITEAYERSAPDRFAASVNVLNPLPTRIDVGNPLYSWLLGPGWLPSQSGDRWMSAKASVRLKVPREGNKLLLEGNFTEEQLKSAPRHLVVSGSGIAGASVQIGETQISDPESTFRRLFSLPTSIARNDVVDLEIRVDPVTHKDGQDYGVVFGKMSILP